MAIIKDGVKTFEDFNPHSPWGERHLTALPFDESADFNPRSPWGERQQNPT